MYLSTFFLKEPYVRIDGSHISRTLSVCRAHISLAFLKANVNDEVNRRKLFFTF